MCVCFVYLCFDHKIWLIPAIKVANKAEVPADTTNAVDPLDFPLAVLPDGELPP
jgi:hypothetical protein